MAKNTGKEYEQFVESIYQALTKDERFTTVERDVNLEGKDGPRQIDVLLRSEVANINLLTVIECRDYNKRLSVVHVDGLHSKLQDVNASKGVLVSRKGFSSTAKQKASRVGITLCLASDAGSVLKEIETEIPIKICHIKIGGHVDFTTKILIAGSTFTLNDAIKELGFFDILYEKLTSGNPAIPPSQYEIQNLLKKIKLPHPIKDSKGNVVANLTAMTLNLKFSNIYYYWHLNNVPDLSSMHQYDSDSTIFIIKAEDFPKLFKLLPTMTKFESEDEIPANYRITFNLIDYKFNHFNKKPIKNKPEQVVRFRPRKK